MYFSLSLLLGWVVPKYSTERVRKCKINEYFIFKILLMWKNIFYINIFVFIHSWWQVCNWHMLMEAAKTALFIQTIKIHWENSRKRASLPFQFTNNLLFETDKKSFWVFLCPGHPSHFCSSSGITASGLDRMEWTSNFAHHIRALECDDSWSLEFDDEIDPNNPDPGWKTFIWCSSAW